MFRFRTGTIFKLSYTSQKLESDIRQKKEPKGRKKHLKRVGSQPKANKTHQQQHNQRAPPSEKQIGRRKKKAKKKFNRVDRPQHDPVISLLEFAG